VSKISWHNHLSLKQLPAGKMLPVGHLLRSWLGLNRRAAAVMQWPEAGG